MFWFFKKKSSDLETQRKIEVIHSSVSGSFQNIKRDMTTLGLWLSNLKDSDHHQNKRLETIESQLAHILRKLEHHENQLSSHAVSIDSLSVPQSNYEYEEEVEDKSAVPQGEELFIKGEQSPFKIPSNAEKVNLASLITSLTETQKLMFIKLISLQRESGNWVPFKTLAEELYPGKDYSDVRSTISEYLTLLTEWGLVTKKRTGKQSFVQVTAKGHEVIDYLKSESKKQDKISIKKRKQHA